MNALLLFIAGKAEISISHIKLISKDTKRRTESYTYTLLQYPRKKSNFNLYVSYVIYLLSFFFPSRCIPQIAGKVEGTLVLRYFPIKTFTAEFQKHCVLNIETQRHPMRLYQNDKMKILYTYFTFSSPFFGLYSLNKISIYTNKTIILHFLGSHVGRQ